MYSRICSLLVSLVLLLLLSACAGKKVPIVVLDCPEEVTYTSKKCASDEADAKAKTIKAVKPNYGCTEPCVRKFEATAGKPGNECVLRVNPVKHGREYDVELKIKCVKPRK